MTDGYCPSQIVEEFDVVVSSWIFVVHFLLCCQVGSADLRWLLGMLTQPEEGKYFLEDLVTRLPLDLSNAVSPCLSALLLSVSLLLCCCSFGPVSCRHCSVSVSVSPLPPLLLFRTCVFSPVDRANLENRF